MAMYVSAHTTITNSRWIAACKNVNRTNWSRNVRTSETLFQALALVAADCGTTYQTDSAWNDRRNHQKRQQDKNGVSLVDQKLVVAK
jgi:hypothetical protein